ncbi:MAG TPA: hypothetical protein VGM88_04390 [Kofleriaceae bacterium]|jgi:hypothetical protein
MRAIVVLAVLARVAAAQPALPEWPLEPTTPGRALIEQGPVVIVAERDRITARDGNGALVATLFAGRATRVELDPALGILWWRARGALWALDFGELAGIPEVIVEGGVSDGPSTEALLERGVTRAGVRIEGIVLERTPIERARAELDLDHPHPTPRSADRSGCAGGCGLAVPTLGAPELLLVTGKTLDCRWEHAYPHCVLYDPRTGLFAHPTSPAAWHTDLRPRTGECDLVYDSSARFYLLGNLVCSPAGCHRLPGAVLGWLQPGDEPAELPEQLPWCDDED